MTTNHEITVERNDDANDNLGRDRFVAYAWITDDVTGRSDTRTGYGSTTDDAKADLMDALREENLV